MTSTSSIIDESRIAIDEDIVTEPATVVYDSIDFVMQAQCFSKWCWAASAASVSAYYDVNTAWQQCTLAIQVLHRPDCCDRPCHQDSAPYNVINTLGSPLHRVHCLAFVRFRKAMRHEVQQELRSKRPLCARTEWFGGSGHFVAIVAYSETSDEIAVRDSLFGDGLMPFDSFCDDYMRSGGRWTHSYFTKPAN